MNGKNHKVLVDLSTVMCGKHLYSGIPQETRVLFKALAETQSIETMGLICGMRSNNLFFKFRNHSDKVRQAILHANIILKLEEKYHTRRWLRYLQTLWAFFKQTYSFWDFGVENNDFIWRKAFAEFIDVECKELLLNQKFFISNFNKFVLNARIYASLPLPKLKTNDVDFVIFQQGLPACPRVSHGTVPIVRFHDAVPLRYPDTIADHRYAKIHGKSILSSGKRAVFVCNSEPVRNELLEMMPSIESNTFVIPPAISTDNIIPAKNDKALATILKSRLSKFSIKTLKSDKHLYNEHSQYILTVSTLEPRKNFISLIRAFERIRYLRDDKLKLIIVGSVGWYCNPILDAMRPHIAEGNIIHLEKVPVYELNMIYASASAFVFPTYYEGFGSTPVEAMQADCPVIVSDIPITRWVLGDAALFCDPYDVISIANTIDRLIYADDASQLQKELITKGRKVAEKYSTKTVGKQWLELFDKLKS